jgi:uncharacterized membrane protein (Fun14 family)
MIEDLAPILPLILPMSLGGVGGFFVGYATKKVYKIAITIGLVVLSVAYLAYVGIINLNINELETISTLISTFGPAVIVALTSSLVFVGSFIVGLLSGFKRG